MNVRLFLHQTSTSMSQIQKYKNTQIQKRGYEGQTYI